MVRSAITWLSLRILMFCAFTGFAIPITALAENDRPNVIVIMSDDQGVGDYGFQGKSTYRNSVARYHV